MSLKLNSSGGGSVTLQEPSTASNRTLNLPDADGTIALTSQIPSAPTTQQVLDATAGASVGAVGTYAWLGDASTVQTVPGGTRAGSNLWYAGLSADSSWSNQLPGGLTAQGGSFGGQPSGTWRAMGLSQPRDNNTRWPTTIWLRIS